jgi:hypothetical protein
MNLFKTTALALVLGAFGLAHSAGDETQEQAQSSSRVAKTIPQLKEEIGIIVNKPAACKRKMEAIAALLAQESDDYTFTPISSVSNAANLIGVKNIDELLAELNLVSKNPAPAAQDEEEEEGSQQGSDSEEEDEEEEEVDEEEGSGSSSGEEEGDEEEAPSEEPSLHKQIAKLEAAAQKLRTEKEEADEAVLALQTKERNLRQSVAQLEDDLKQEKELHIRTNDTLSAQLGTEKQKLQQAEAALSKAQHAEEIARNALIAVQTASKEKETTLTSERDAAREMLEETENTLAAERQGLEEAKAALKKLQEEFKAAQASVEKLTERLAASEKLLAAQAQTHAEELVQKEAAVRAQFAHSVPLAEFQALGTAVKEMDAEIQAKSQVNLDQAKLLRKLHGILMAGNMPKKELIQNLIAEIQSLLLATE